MEKEIREIFINELSEKVVKISDVSKGVDQIVKIVETENSIYIIKLPKKDIEELLLREFIACDKLKNLVPVPKVILKTNNYIIEEFIKGIDLNEANLNVGEKEKIFEELGFILKKIHSINMSGFGWIDIDGNGCFSTLKERVLLFREENLKYLKENFLCENEYLKLIKYLEKYDFYSNSKESVLLHFDFEDFNIKVHNGKVAGILDFGDLSAGPCAYDLARLFISHYEDGMFDYFLKGYGEIDLDEVKYYVVISLLWMIPYNDAIKKDEKRLELELKLLKNII